MIEIRNLSKSFVLSGSTVKALNNVSLTIEDGDIYGIIGMSGAGKSTLVRCINMLERPTEGTVVLDGQDLSVLTPAQLREIRRSVSMIFQGFHLLMQRTCLQNICFPLTLAGMKKQAAQERAKELLELVGLPDKADAYPAQLSGGQQQRIAIARALATNPKVLLCDEATSALDPKTTHSILELIRDINQTMGITVIVITHQMSVVEEICSHVAILDGGIVVEEGEVSRILTAPSSTAGRHLVFPEGEAGKVICPPGQQLIRLVFNGANAVGTPFIACMAVEKNIAATIITASTKSIGEKVYGQMLLGIPCNQMAAAMEYLSTMPNVTAQEVTDHV